jgi:Protein of unknown function (DUF2567)
VSEFPAQQPVQPPVPPEPLGPRAPFGPGAPLAPAVPAQPSATPRTSRGRSAGIVVSGLALIGVLTGGLWAWIAPPIHAVVALARTGDRVHDYLGTESQHFFVGPTLLIGLLTVVAVVATVLLWQWREQRGPAIVVALFVGVLSAAALAAVVGAVLVRLRYGDLNFDAVPLSREHRVAYVIQAPPVFYARKVLQVAATLLWPTATACFVYAVFAAASSRDDLDGLPEAIGPLAYAPPVQPQAAEGAVS